MSMSLEDVDTDLEAYRLVYDPTKLLSLLFSKYGDIEEDFDLLHSNQILYNKSTKLNIAYKELQYDDQEEEFLKRFYRDHESTQRIPKLADYYKNYHVYFCRPTFRHFYYGNLLHNYEDNKAEIFYKNNYADSNEKKSSNINQSNSNSSSLSSLDNITSVKTIFDPDTKKIIDENLKSDRSSVTLNLNSSRTHMPSGLITKRGNNDSFEKIIDRLINYKPKPKKKESKPQVSSNKLSQKPTEISVQKTSHLKETKQNYGGNNLLGEKNNSNNNSNNKCNINSNITNNIQSKIQQN